MRSERSFAVPVKFFALLCAMLGVFLVKNILFRICGVPAKLPIDGILWSLLSAVVIAFMRDSLLWISYGHYFRVPCVVFLEQYGNAHAVLGFVYDASWRTVIVLVKHPHAHWRHIGTDGHISIFPHHEG